MRVHDKDIALCNVEGRFYAVGRKCGHEDAPLNLGTLSGHVITCPLHFAQFDVRDGKALFGPCPRNYGVRKGEITVNALSDQLTRDLLTYEVRMDGEDVLVDLG